MATHERWLEQLSEYVDDELDAGAVIAVEAHLAECEACRAACDAVRRVKTRGVQLHDVEPPTDLWPSIATRLSAQPLGVVPGEGRRRTLSLSWAQVAAAVIVLAGLSSSAAWYARGLGKGVSAVAALDTAGTRFDFQQPGGATVWPARRAVPAGPPPSVEVAVPSFDSAMTDLRSILAAARGRLRPETVKVLESNLRAIDQAIADARRALQKDPESAAYLNPYLQGQMTRKLELLRQAAELASATDDD